MMHQTLRTIALVPPSLLTMMTLLRIDPSNIFVMVGLFSLLFISSVERFKWAGVILVYLPAAYTVSLLLTGVVSPFLGLAAGYILAAPLVMAVSGYKSTNFIGLVSGYFTSYVFALLLHNVSATGVVQPERLFVTLVRSLLGVFSAERINLTPTNPEPSFVYESLTALATFALILTLTFRDRRQKPSISPKYVKTISTTLALLAAIILVTELSPELSPYLLMGSVVAFQLFVALKMRALHE